MAITLVDAFLIATTGFIGSLTLVGLMFAFFIWQLYKENKK